MLGVFMGANNELMANGLDVLSSSEAEPQRERESRFGSSKRFAQL